MDYTKTTIKHIVPEGPWESQHGTLYAQKITFADDVVGAANTKSETPPYVEGDTVWYAVTSENSYGKKVKVTKNDPESTGGAFAGGAGRGQSDATTKRIEASWAITTAIAWAALEGSELNEDELVKGARLVLELRDTIHQA